MEIVFLKSGKFAFHPVSGPIQICNTGDKIEINDCFAKQLIEAKWAEEYIERLPPWKEKDFDRKAPNAKDRLQEYVESEFGESIDKRRAVSTLIKDIARIKKLHGR